jgi:hypothetical protein
LETLGAELQDVQLLLLSHLLVDVVNSHSQSWVYCQRIPRFLPTGSVHSDTQAVLETLELKTRDFVNGGENDALPEFPCGAEQCIDSVPESPIVHSPYPLLV